MNLPSYRLIVRIFRELIEKGEEISWLETDEGFPAMLTKTPSD